MAKHYIAMSGLHGCMPDYCTACETIKDAVESLANLFELGSKRKRRLRKDLYLELGSEDGAQYAEITDCDCAEPWTHDEHGEPEQWADFMREHRDPLPVIFRVDKKSKTVVAVFPTQQGTNDPHTFMTYAHVGQHSAGSKSWYWTTRPAKLEEYQDLYTELCQIYEEGIESVDLKVVKVFQRKYDEQRQQS